MSKTSVEFTLGIISVYSLMNILYLKTINEIFKEIYIIWIK